MRLLRYRFRGLRRGPFVVFLAAVLPGGGTLAAQADSTIRYRAEPLACLALHQSVTSVIETAHGDDRRTETAGWDGDLILRARADTAGAVSLTAWFQRLKVWRDTPEGRLEPAADGMLGGRYRGALSPVGDYQPTAVPFVPEAVSAVAAMEAALDELLPPLPTEPIAPGDTESDGRGWSFDRLSDTLMPAGRAWRLRLFRRDTTAVSVDWGDGQVSEGESVEEERGRLVWRPGVGPLSWIRHITTVVTFPATEVSARSLRTEVRQERRFERIERLPPDRCSVP